MCSSWSGLALLVLCPPELVFPMLLQVRALRTSASTQELLDVAVERCGYQLRKDSPYYCDVL